MAPKATDYVNEEIRLGKITREEGIRLVEQYDGCCGSHYIESFCEYISITTDQFWAQVHDNLNKELFEIKENGSISRKFEVGVGIK